MCLLGTRLTIGPPPRTWGIPRQSIENPLPRRSTPTHVGNTRFAGSRFMVVPVHPHARGEYAGGNGVVTSSGGPPPRTWGIPNVSIVKTIVSRSTPTHVGNTPNQVGQTITFSVHPHARGEYTTGDAGVLEAIGPPPRTWGIRQYCQFLLAKSRSTPTHVGNTIPPPSSCRFHPVHPHARGEYPGISR